MALAAAVSIVALIGVGVWRVADFASVDADDDSETRTASSSIPALGADWQQEMILLGITTEVDPSATSSNDSVSMIGPQVMAQLLGNYIGLNADGKYSLEAAAKAAESIAPNVRATVSYQPYDLSDFKTDDATTYDRMLTYRADLRIALAPLLENKESELEVYGRYIESADPAHLATLKVMAQNYRAAVSLAAAVVVPKDAVGYHRSVVNAMVEFATVLDSLADHGDDAFASVALLRTYNDAEQKLLTSFDALTRYYAQKQP